MSVLKIDIKPKISKYLVLYLIRLSYLHDSKIVEHWSIADMAGLMQQLQA
jgi:predicted ester cyclase